MNYKYDGLVDNEFDNNSSEKTGSTKAPNINGSDINLNNIYAKIVKIRKELEKSYNLFYSYNLIVENKDDDNTQNNCNNAYSTIYKRNEGGINSFKNTKDNLTLNKINALTNSFYMNVDILKNSYSFLKDNNKLMVNENVIWEKRIETLAKESSSYIKTLDNIYKTNLNQSELNKKKNMYNKSNKKKNIDDEISYLHNEKEILKQVEENINVFQIQGLNTLHMLRKQNKFLKNVRKKSIDVYNYVGFSSSILDSITKAHKQNLYIVIFGIIGSSLFFYFMYTYFKG